MGSLLSYNALDNILNYTVSYGSVSGSSYVITSEEDNGEEDSDGAFGIGTNAYVAVSGSLVIALAMNIVW